MRIGLTIFGFIGFIMICALLILNQILNYDDEEDDEE